MMQLCSRADARFRRCYVHAHSWARMHTSFGDWNTVLHKTWTHAAFLPQHESRVFTNYYKQSRGGYTLRQPPGVRAGAAGGGDVREHGLAQVSTTQSGS